MPTVRRSCGVGAIGWLALVQTASGFSVPLNGSSSLLEAEAGARTAGQVQEEVVDAQVPPIEDASNLVRIGRGGGRHGGQRAGARNRPAMPPSAEEQPGPNRRRGGGAASGFPRAREDWVEAGVRAELPMLGGSGRSLLLLASWFLAPVLGLVLLLCCRPVSHFMPSRLNDDAAAKATPLLPRSPTVPKSDEPPVSPESLTRGLLRATPSEDEAAAPACFCHSPPARLACRDTSSRDARGRGLASWRGQRAELLRVLLLLVPDLPAWLPPRARSAFEDAAAGGADRGDTDHEGGRSPCVRCPSLGSSVSVCPTPQPGTAPASRRKAGKAGSPGVRLSDDRRGWGRGGERLAELPALVGTDGEPECL